jgi:hypothetical protein
MILVVLKSVLEDAEKGIAYNGKPTLTPTLTLTLTLTLTPNPNL